ncbi:MAG: DUF2961 domain-containing protein [Thermofilaceae archaeon]
MVAVGLTETVATLVPVAAILAVFLLAVKGHPDWSLRRSVPVYSSVAVVQGTNVPANSEKTLLEVSGRGQVEGLTVKFTGIPTLVHGELRIYIDGSTQPAVIFPAGAVALFFHGTTVDVGRFALPLTVTVYDTTNNVYGFSVTVPIRFSSSIRITVYNYHTSAITVDFAAVVSLEK